MSNVHPVPCGNLIEPGGEQPARCDVGRTFPNDCPTCSAYTPGLTDQERTRCEVWTRVMGYHRPVSAFNAGKQAEHAERTHFSELAASRGRADSPSDEAASETT